ncbi:MAG: hypothetical protein ACI4JM_07500 [Oscillospiraceae bacterium]
MNNIDIYEEFEEIANEKTTKENKGRKLAAKTVTYNLDEGTYSGTITNAFWYKKDGRDRVMFEYQLDDGKEFVNSVDGEWVDKYPFSRLISQADIEYVEDFIGLNVTFDIHNTQGDEVMFSNVKRIRLVE